MARADRAEKLGIADLPVECRTTEQLLGKEDGAIEQHYAGDNRPAGKVTGESWMVDRHQPDEFSGWHG
jgi:hypothetical protein